MALCRDWRKSWMRPQLEGARRLGPLPSEGKGHKFESCRARHDFNDLAGIAKERLMAAEAPRKLTRGSNRTVCRTPVVTNPNELHAGGRAAVNGGRYHCE